MRISEIIAKYQEMQDKHGDLECMETVVDFELYLTTCPYNLEIHVKSYVTKDKEEVNVLIVE